MKIVRMLAAVSAFAVVGMSTAIAAEAPAVTPAEGLKAVARDMARADGSHAGQSTAETFKVAQRRLRRNRGKFRRGRRGRRGRNYGKGVAIGAAAALILGLAANASASERRGRCNRLWDRCDDGERWACRKADRAGC